MSDVIFISRYDSLIYDITLEQKSGTTGVVSPVTSGVVTAYICPWPPRVGVALSSTTVTLNSLGNGRYIGQVPADAMGAALATLQDDELIAVIYELNGVMVRFREARVASILRVEAIGGGTE